MRWLALILLFTIVISSCKDEDEDPFLPSEAELCQRCEASIPDPGDFVFTITSNLNSAAEIRYNGYVGECFQGEPKCTGWVCKEGPKLSHMLEPGASFTDTVQSQCVDEFFFCLMYIEFEDELLENRFGRSDEFVFEYELNYDSDQDRLVLDRIE